MLTVMWKTCTEDLPQATIQIIYWIGTGKENSLILISAIASISFTLISSTYAFILIYFTEARRNKLAKFLNTIKKRAVTVAETALKRAATVAETVKDTVTRRLSIKQAGSSGNLDG
jgi:hypothetical protein